MGVACEGAGLLPGNTMLDARYWLMCRVMKET